LFQEKKLEKKNMKSIFNKANVEEEIKKKIKKIKDLKKDQSQLVWTFEIYDSCYKSKINFIKGKI